MGVGSSRAVVREWAAYVCAVAICLGFAGHVAAQDAPPLPKPADASPQTPTIRVNARLVVLDVSATDRSGKPIDGLTANDFRITEDGAPQRIRTFEAPGAHALPTASEQGGAAVVFDPSQPASFGTSPVTILLLDQLNTHFADSAFARREMQNFLNTQASVLAQPTTLLTISEGHFKQLAPFTRDRAALIKALSSAPVKYPWSLELYGKAESGPIARLELSLNVLEAVAQSYASIRGRKNLVWVGNGAPTLDPQSIQGRDQAEVEATLQHVTNVLLETRMTLNAVDPTSTAAGMTEITDETQQAFAMDNADIIGHNFESYGAGADFDKLGEVSGGRVVRGLNNISAQIAAAVLNGTHYYTVSYTPSTQSREKSAYRRIRVECLRPGCMASTRQGYFTETTAVDTSRITVGSDLSAAAESSVPLRGLQVRTEDPSATAEQEKRFAVVVNAPGLTWTPQDNGTSRARVYVMAASLDKNGRVLEHTVSLESAYAKAGVNLSDDSKSATFAMMASPAAKATTLRFVVRDATSGLMGTVDVPVTKK